MRRRLFALIVAVIGLCLAAPASAGMAQRAAAQYGYIFNEGSNAIVIFDPASGKVVGTVADDTLNKPHSSAYDPAGRRIFIGDLSGNLTVYDVSNPRAPRLVTVARPGGNGEIHDVFIAGGLVWLAHLGDSTVYAYDPGDFSRPLVALGKDRGFDTVHGLALRPGTDELYTLNRPAQGRGFVLRVNVRTRQVIGGPLPTTNQPGDQPNALSFSVDGRAYIGNGGMNAAQVTVIDPTTFTVAAQIQQDPQRGRSPWAPNFDRNTGRVFVANLRGGTVSAIDVATNTVVGYVEVGNNPRYAQIGPDGRIYVTVAQDNKVVIFDPRTLMVLGEIRDPAIAGPNQLIFVDASTPGLPNTGAGRGGDHAAIEAILSAALSTLLLGLTLALYRRRARITSGR